MRAHSKSPVLLVSARRLNLLPIAAVLALIPAGATPLAGASETPTQSPAKQGATQEQLGDLAFARRAEGAPGDGTAAAGPIDEAIQAYEAALAASPDATELRVKLLRALFFSGEYVPADKAQRKATFERGRTVFEEGRARLASQIGGTKALTRLSTEEVARKLEHVPFAGELYFWGAVHWGLWGDYFGNMAALRKGVAKKIRRYGTTARAFDEEFDAAGPIRLLGRMHSRAPRVPFVTGWVDHGLGVELLERANEIAPRDPLNRLFLAEALLEHARTRRSEAIVLLCGLQNEHPRSTRLVEDTQAAVRARHRLRELGTTSCPAEQAWTGRY